LCDPRYAKMTYEEFGALLGVIASQNKESFPSYEAYTQYLQSLPDSTSISITLLFTTSTNLQQVNTLAEEFLDYNEDEANLNISPEVVDIEEIIDDKSVDNEEDLYSPPSIPLITTAQARSHVTELVQYLEALSVPNFLVEQSLI